MLKWTVLTRRESEKSQTSCRNKNIDMTTTTQFKCCSSRHSNNRNNRISTIDDNKENHFTSTPIKSFDDHQFFDVLRDVSNLTPTNTTKHQFSDKKKRNSRSKTKKKKLILESENFFYPFESVDSHISNTIVENNNVLVDYNSSQNIVREQIHLDNNYPSTTPCQNSCRKNLRKSIAFLKNGRLKNILQLDDNDTDNDYKPNKRPKIDHVNEFLNEIYFKTSPEDEQKILPNSFRFSLNSPKLYTPLVKQVVDFNKINVNNETLADNSSFLNDLSIDKIVDAIIDKSNETPDNCQTKKVYKEIEQEKITLELNSERKNLSIPSLMEMNNMSEGFFNKTIITVEESFNERCIDDVSSSRKRKLSSTKGHNDINNTSKQIGSDKSDEENLENFTLRRQKCIRRRKVAEDETRINVKKINNDQNPLKSDNTDHYFDNGSFCDNSSSNILWLCTPTTSNGIKFRKSIFFKSPSISMLEISSSSSSEQQTKGLINLIIYWNKSNLIVHVIDCKELYRLSGKQINAYVKVIIMTDQGNYHKNKRNSIIQRTAVHADSSRPFFNAVFTIPVKDLSNKRIFIEVWHRDRITRTSEFLGYTSFDARHAYTKEIRGLYRLFSQKSIALQNVSITSEKEEHQLPVNPIMYESHSSVEEAISVDDFDGGDIIRKSLSKTVLSEQQKYADENLFLRYLELDPVDGPEAIPAAMQRKATGNKFGRTPFTHTKKLVRLPKSGFGFSVVWTHPPRIERVEKGMPADKAGILPGDYIIFVDKHNVVMMPETDILNLIRSYGSQLILEIFRRNTSRNGSVSSVKQISNAETYGSTAGLPAAPLTSVITSSNIVQQRRPSTVCSTTNTLSIDYNRKKLHLPQVTFNTEKMTNNQDENRKRTIYQLISKEQQYAAELQFGNIRFLSALAERRDLITSAEHKILFQNFEEILRITEDILDNIIQDDGDAQINLLVKTYHAKLGELLSAYRRYCTGIKKADCILANKTKNSNSEFVTFLQNPSIPHRRPDITALIHKPLQHFREILKFLTVIQSNTTNNHEDFPVINQIVHNMQLTYKEITAEAGLMEPIGEGRPLLTVQDVENRIVFTKCQPFVLNKPGRQWIFGGDLGKVEGRNVRQYWTLLFNDILLFSKVSRDRVLFVLEDPIPLLNIVDTIFNIRKKDTEFRITTLPGGRKATSPTVHCGPDLTRTPKKNSGKRTIILRAPTIELKAVWQNLLQKQIFQVNTGVDSSSLSSPLECYEAPITSSVATFQSAESLSYQRQNRNYLKEKPEIIENKNMGKNYHEKGNSIHLEKWMRDQLKINNLVEAEMESLPEEWTEEMLRKRSQELHLIDEHGNIRNNSKFSNSNDIQSNDNQFNQNFIETTKWKDQNQTGNKLPAETISVCRQCHKNCISSKNIHSDNNRNLNKNNNKNNNRNNNNGDDVDDDNDWRSFFLMGLSGVNPSVTLVKLDPFDTPLPTISVDSPTIDNNYSCNCHTSNQNNNYNNFIIKDVDVSPDDSPETDEHPYHSLNSSNLTLRRYGTVSSLEKVEFDNVIEIDNHASSSDDDDDDDDDDDNNDNVGNNVLQSGFDKGNFFQSSSFEQDTSKFNFEDYKNSNSTSKSFERYLKTSVNMKHYEDIQDDDISGATSGEEIWGTPTSGGEYDDSLNSPNYEEGKRSPYDDGGSYLNDNDDTELMLDELLMRPSISGAVMRGLLPRRTLEPLIEEECSESNTPSSTSTTPTESSIILDQGKVIGNVADICSVAVQDSNKMNQKDTTKNIELSKMHRSDSYRKIIEAANENSEENINVQILSRFKPAMKLINIETFSRSTNIKLFEFFKIRRERRIHQIPDNRQLFKLFSKDGNVSDEVPTSYSDKPTINKFLKDKQMDRRFWKQLSKRRDKLVNSSTD